MHVKLGADPKPTLLKYANRAAGTFLLRRIRRDELNKRSMIFKYLRIWAPKILKWEVLTMGPDDCLKDR